MIFLKEHLSGTYEWPSENERILLDTVPSRRLFNRWNGYQTLFVINLFLMQAGLALEHYGKKAENILLAKLPLDDMSEKKVLAWLNAQSGDIIS